MAKMENTKMTVSLDNDSKRVIRSLIKSIDRLSRNLVPHQVVDPENVKRLTEPAEDGNTTQEFATGGYVSSGTFPEPDRGTYIPAKTVTLDPEVIQRITSSVAGKYSALG